MKMKTLGLCVALSVVALPCYAGLKLGNVLKTPSTSNSNNGGAGLTQVTNGAETNADKRKAELQKWYEAAPDKRQLQLTEYFNKKFGKAGVKKNPSEPPTWLVRVDQGNGTQYCLQMQLSVQGNRKGTSNDGEAVAYLDFSSLHCDHPNSAWAPLVMDFMN